MFNPYTDSEKKNFKSDLLASALTVCGLSLAMSTVGAVRNSPLMFLSGIAGTFGSLGAVASGSITYDIERKRISGIIGNSRQSFTDGYSKGWEECRILKDDELFKSCQESFDNGFAKATQITTENLTETHRKELGNLRQQLTDEHQLKVSKLQEEHATKIKQLIGQHGLELEAQKGDYERVLADLMQQLKTWKEKETFLEMKEREWHDWRVDIAESKGLIRAVEQENLDLQNKLAEADAEFKNRMIEIENRARDLAAQSYEQGFGDASDKADLELQKYRLTISRLETELGRKKRDDKFNKRLPTLAKALAGNFKPMAFCGGQRSGKGTSIVATVRAVTPEKIGGIPICLDVGEGGVVDDKENTTWYRAGIPNTNDPRVFLEVMRSIRDGMTDNRAFTMSDEFAKQPPIFLIIDELQTVIDELDKQERAEFISLVTTFHTRGKKKGVYLYLATQSYQIQNMGPKGNPIINGGQLNNFDIILINDELRKFVDDNAKKYQDWELHEYFASFEGQYQCALLRSKKLTPIRHPSHHRIDQKDKEPSEFIDPVVLAPIPTWLAPAFNLVYVPPTAHRLSPTGSPSVIEPSPGWEGEPAEPPKLPPAGDVAGDGGKITARNWGAELDVSEDKLGAFEDAILRGEPMTASIENILGISKGGKSRRYQIAREFYQSMESK